MKCHFKESHREQPKCPGALRYKWSSPQSILLFAIRLSQPIFTLLGLPQALHTENNVQKMSMRLKGRVKLKILVS